MARIFISYRSADGADKATALARELGQRFGHAQVFIDKDDLRGGVAWRAEVGRAIGARPVLLLLVTPQMLSATDAAGRLRIADPDDPVCREVEAALAAGATLLPVLCDGVDTLPAGLPAPFDHLAELTWRRLRAYDWTTDTQRLVDDLLCAGVPARAAGPTAGQPGSPDHQPATESAAGHGAAPPPATPIAQTRRRMLWVGTLAAVTAGSGLAWWWRSGSADAADLGGHWTATLAGDGEILVVLEQLGVRLTLASAPVPLAGRADWEPYRRFWQERTGRPLEAFMYSGEGDVQRLPGQPPVADLAIQLLALPERSPVDSGNLNLVLQPDGRWRGERWLNSVQAATPALLVRRR